MLAYKIYDKSTHFIYIYFHDEESMIDKTCTPSLIHTKNDGFKIFDHLNGEKIA